MEPAQHHPLSTFLESFHIAFQKIRSGKGIPIQKHHQISPSVFDSHIPPSTASLIRSQPLKTEIGQIHFFEHFGRAVVGAIVDDQNLKMPRVEILLLQSTEYETQSFLLIMGGNDDAQFHQMHSTSRWHSYSTSGDHCHRFRCPAGKSRFSIRNSGIFLTPFEQIIR